MDPPPPPSPPRLSPEPGADLPRYRAGDQRDEEFARRFGEALRSGDAAAAEGITEEALQAGVNVAGIHTRLIEPAMRWIGALWERDVISVGEEHLATAISHGAAARIFRQGLRANARSRERVMLAAVQGEQHVLGLRLVADVLEGVGYDVLYLGADLPLPSLLEACRVHQPEVLGLTVGMQSSVPTLIWEIQELAKLPEPPALMIGGYAIGPALKRLEVPMVMNCEQVLAAVAALIEAPGSRGSAGAEREPASPDPASAGALGRAPITMAPEGLASSFLAANRAAGESDLSVAFSATSLVAADALRESARHAFEMEQLAYRDGLTGLANRRAFDDRFLAMSEQTPEENMMLMIDVDEFKAINDRYGHDAGDKLLVSVARTIRQAIRPGDFAARFGGDEFVALLPRTSEADAADIAERIRMTVAEDSSGPATTVSIGVAAFSATHRLTSLSADQALYRAKESGRNCVAAGG